MFLKIKTYLFISFIALSFLSCTKENIILEKNYWQISNLKFKSMSLQDNKIYCNLLLPTISKSIINKMQALGPTGFLVRIKKDQNLIGSFFIHFGFSPSVLFKNSSSTSSSLPYSFILHPADRNKVFSNLKIEKQTSSTNNLDFVLDGGNKYFEPTLFINYTMRMIEFTLPLNFQGLYTLDWALYNPEKKQILGTFIDDLASFNISSQ